MHVDTLYFFSFYHMWYAVDEYMYIRWNKMVSSPPPGVTSLLCVIVQCVLRYTYYFGRSVCRAYPRET